MKSKIHLFLLTILISLFMFGSNAMALNSNGGTVNSHMNNLITVSESSTIIGGWHSSGGYWRFDYNDWEKSFNVYDYDVPSYFSGTSKTFPYTLNIYRKFYGKEKDFISIYGKDKLSFKLEVGKSGSILNDYVGYTIDDSGIRLTFKPILRYDRYNMWGYHNPNIWKAMSGKVYTPEVTPGYGENYVSIRGGIIGMKLTPSIMRSAYRASDGTLRFTSSEATIDGNEAVTYPNQEVVSSVFFSGGSTSAYFRYPIKLQYYDINVSAGIYVSNYEYKNGNVYWVKAGDDFTINTSGTPSATDSLVRPTQNTVKIDMTGATQYLDFRKTASSSTVQQYETNSGNIVNFDGSKITSSTAANGTFYVSSGVNISGDKDILISSMTRLNNFTYGTWNTSKLYKTSNWTGTISIKSDANAPSSYSLPSSKVNSISEMYIRQDGINDSRSGLNQSSVYAYVYNDSNNRGEKIYLSRINNYNDYHKTINFDNYSHLRNAYGDLKVDVYATDNVGNEGLISSKTVTREFPKPKNHSVVIKDYEYEDSTTKWVKLNDNFKVCNSVEAYKGNGINGFDVIYDLNKNTADYNSYFKAWVYNNGTNYNYVNGFGQLANNQPINSEYVSPDYNRYSKCIDSVANSMNLNGHKFAVWSRVNYSDGVYNQTTGWIKDSKLLGIDGKAPTINWTGNGNTVTITVDDKESGVNRVVITQNGNQKTYWTNTVTLVANKTITVTVYDNVGNSQTKTIPPITNPAYGKYWDGVYIKTAVSLRNNKYVLDYIADAEVWDLWYNGDTPVFSNHSLMFTATSSKYLAQVGSVSKTTNNSIVYQGVIEDRYNRPYGPTLSYQKNNSTYAKVVWNHIEDINDNVTLRLYKDGNLWDEVVKDFASGRKDYKWVLYQTGDRYGNSITKKKIDEGYTDGTEVNMSTCKTGSYEIEVTMYDKNGNPSGTSKLSFQHTQPEINTDVSDLFLKVTAVKDLNWESMDYPIKYNSLEFPLGKNKLSKNGEGIKLGYVVNFSIENLIKHNLADWNATYTLLGENGELLTATSNGKTLKESDTKDGTGYLFQTKSMILADKDPSPDATNRGYADRLFFKHFIPADAEFFKTDGSVYRGKVTVRVKIYLKEVGTDGVVGENNYTVDLYTIDTSDSAYDDLIIDKQR